MRPFTLHSPPNPIPHAELKSYGINGAELDALKAAADKFTLLNPAVRQVKLDDKTLLAQLKAKIKELNDLLRTKLDHSMMVMGFTKPEFFELYKNARRNYTLGVRHEQPTPTMASIQTPKQPKRCWRRNGRSSPKAPIP